MTIDRDEKCAFCGFPRHAHWGGPQALVAGRCAGFESSAATKLNAAAPDLLEALRVSEELLLQTLRWRGEGWECSEDELLGDIRAAIAKATGADQ